MHSLHSQFRQLFTWRLETLGHTNRALRAYMAHSRGLRYTTLYLKPRESFIYAARGTLAWLKVSRGRWMLVIKPYDQVAVGGAGVS